MTQFSDVMSENDFDLNKLSKLFNIYFYFVFVNMYNYYYFIVYCILL